MKSIWLPTVEAGTLSWGRPSHLTFALEAVKSPVAVAALLQQLKNNQLPPASRGDVIDFVASVDPKKNADVLLDLAVGADISDDTTRLQIASALQRMARNDHADPAHDPARIESLFGASDPQLRASAVQLAGLWKIESARPQLEKFAEDQSTPISIRAAAFDALGTLGGDGSKTLLEAMSDEPNDPAVRSAAIAALASIDLRGASSLAAKLLAAGSVADLDPLLEPFLQREAGADALATALAGRTIPSSTARASLQCLQAHSAGDSPLAQLLQKSAGAASGPVRLSPQEMRLTIADVLAKGDAARGELIFRRRETGCYQCHAIDGAGGFLAPDLGSIGASSPMDYVIDSILDPNKAVKDGFMGVTVVTRDGDVISGIKIRQDAKELVLKDSTHEQIVIPLKNVRRQKDTGSLMPTGLTDSLTRPQFLDLIRFVSELGKPGPFGPSSVPVARRWRLLDPPAAEAGADSSAFPSAVGSAASWSPVYSLVNGDLPVDALRGSVSSKFAIVQCQINATTGGKTSLHLGEAAGLAVWVDQNAIPVAQDVPIQLTPGVHALTFRVILADRGERPLRVELRAASASDTRAEFVGGR